MNIFYLNKDPRIAAELHVDKHVVKMIVEYAQLLSTAKRMIDGTKYEARSKTNRKVQRYRLENANFKLVIFVNIFFICRTCLANPLDPFFKNHFQLSNDTKMRFQFVNQTRKYKGKQQVG